ncbi:unnamed protein product [Nezara viridula]|uniref:Uncharacterized protein n=1 Tax=Nezara viridula TaxID=85310 RepID=A0A9P0ECH0_NEZVI|nr:unnamed protein product [Nezara viridula]
MTTLPTIIEEFTGEQVLNKICDYKNLSFFMSNIPEDVNDTEYISFLRSNNIRAIVRPNHNSQNYMLSLAKGISDFVINFPDPIPDGFLIKLFLKNLKHFIAEEEHVSIAIEESVEGAYLLVYVLIELGVNLKEAIEEIKKLDLELEKTQVDFLRRRSRQLKRMRNVGACTIS